MAYIRKIIAPEEKLIGIARCHWIYIAKGLVWFCVMAGIGWVLNQAIMLTAFTLSDFTEGSAPIVLMKLANGAMWAMVATGLLVFFFQMVKVLVTEVGLTTRRVILKEGFIFVKMKDIDLEEIRGESLDLGSLGRLLGYGFLKLDCRFIGDVMLPAIENPEGFLNALHSARSKTQDALAIVVGKGEKHPIVQAAPVEGVDTPSVNPQQPTPEIQPGIQPAQPEVQPQPTTPTVPQNPEIPTMPTPHNPPPQTAPSPAPEQIPQPAQPIPAPLNPEPPLQPPASVQPPQQPAAVDSAAVAQAMEQVMPHMVQEVVKQMAEQGLIPTPAPANDDNVDTDLISSFDEASEKGSGHELHNKVEHAIH